MIALLQRVNYAKVVVEGKTVGEIDKGILVFLGLEREDNEQLCHKMFDKILKYRMFYDENEKMNLNVSQVNGNVLVVSQFTLAANTASGNRPSFDPAMPPSEAKELYDKFSRKPSARKWLREKNLGEPLMQIYDNEPLEFFHAAMDETHKDDLFYYAAKIRDNVNQEMKKQDKETT